MTNAGFNRCLLEDPTTGTFGMPLAISLASSSSHVTLTNVILSTKASVFGSYLTYVVEGGYHSSANLTTVGVCLETVSGVLSSLHYPAMELVLFLVRIVLIVGTSFLCDSLTKTGAWSRCIGNPAPYCNCGVLVCLSLGLGFFSVRAHFSLLLLFMAACPGLALSHCSLVTLPFDPSL